MHNDDLPNARWLGLAEVLTPEQVRCLDTLCSVHRVYNLVGYLTGEPCNSDKFEFGPGSLRVGYRGSMSTFDMDELTRLVMAGHLHCVRVEVSPRSNRTFDIFLNARQPDGTSLYERHPSVADIADWLDNPPGDDLHNADAAGAKER